MREAHVKAGEGADEATDRIRNDRKAERLVLVDVLVGVDQDVVDLRRKAFERVLHHGPAVKQYQSLVDAAHAPALSAGQYHTCDTGHAACWRCAHASVRNRSPPVNNRKCLLVARPIMVMPTFCAIS